MLPAPLRPRWDGRSGRFEIWFLVVFDRASRRAFWLRHTLFAERHEGPARASVWAAFFDPDGEPRRVAGKTFAPLPAGEVPWPLQLDGCVLDRERAEGRLGELLGWSLRFPPADGVPARLPRLPESLPAPSRAWHLLSEAPASGTVRAGGREVALDGVATMMHLEGTRRVDDLAWCYAPMCDAPAGGALELTWVRPRRRGPSLWGFWHDGDLATGMTFTRARVTQPRPGALRAVLRDGGRTFVARAWAEPDEMVGYVYRDPAGHDLHVAQSDIASVVVDVYGRRGRRERRFVRRRGAALEIHQRERLPGVDYLGWDERELPPAHTRRPAPARRDGEGTWEPLPKPRAILALGLTYVDHLRETGHDPAHAPPPVVFAKHARTFLPEGASVAEPDGAAVLAAVADLEPDLAARLRERMPSPPALLDWEGELALVVLEDLDDQRLDDPGRLPVGICVANDLTARSVQILGEGAARSLHFWAAAKSFPGFLPIAPEVWRPPGGIDTAWPDLTIELRVNGRVRQHGRTADLLVTPRSTLRQARDAVARPLRRGDIVLTGTPSGIALQVPRWKRRLAGLLLDRVGRLAIASRGALAGRFLEPGDEVTVDAGPAGARTVVIGA